MHFTASSIALLAVAAGVQAGSHKQAEPPVNQKEGGAAVGTAGTAAGTAVQTGTHPIVTGSGSSNGTSGNNGTASTIPVSVPTGSSGSSGSGSSGSGSSGSGSSGSGSSGSSGSAGAGSGTASNTPSSPSSTGFTPSNAGANVYPMGAAGALVGGAVYGLMLLA
ncbi:hypothetical protein N7528_006932 [Penicillium herquei]|nr:hypothetical protein N7528_006932 [Penicillium herquei]